MVLPSPHQDPGPRTIQNGDLVIVYESFHSVKAVHVDRAASFQNRYGVFPQKEWIGKPFGSRIVSRPPQRGWLHLLAPTAELWTLALRHRTQILYVGDISLVVSGLDLAPGSVVLESGTGSGSLSHSLARAVAPAGKLHTFEFHPQRADEAAKEFEKNGLGALVSVTQRNVEEGGFPAELAGCAHGVFLDLPAPWKVVPSAAASLAPDGRFCSFSPCIEQVQRTVEALDANGFTDIATREILLRCYEVTTETFAAGCSSAGTVRAGKRQMAAAQAAAASRTPQAGASEEGGVQQQEGVAPGAGPDAKTAGRKRKQTDSGDAGDGQADAQAPLRGGVQAGPAGSSPQASGGRADSARSSGGVATGAAVVARPSMDARGHTGYLTFARKFVVVPVVRGIAT